MLKILDSLPYLKVLDGRRIDGKGKFVTPVLWFSYLMFLNVH